MTEATVLVPICPLPGQTAMHCQGLKSSLTPVLMVDILMDDVMNQTNDCILEDFMAWQKVPT